VPHCRPFCRLASGLRHWLALHFDDVDEDGDADVDVDVDEDGAGRGCGLDGLGVDPGVWHGMEPLLSLTKVISVLPSPIVTN